MSWLTDRGIGVFQYIPDFVGSAMELAPIVMPLSPNPYEFPSLPKEAFKELPGMVADSLPDKFGNALIDTWLADAIIRDMHSHLENWLTYADKAGMQESEALKIPRAMRREIVIPDARKTPASKIPVIIPQA